MSLGSVTVNLHNFYGLKFLEPECDCVSKERSHVTITITIIIIIIIIIYCNWVVTRWQWLFYM